MNCPRCGASNPDDAETCYLCYFHLREYKPPEGEGFTPRPLFQPPSSPSEWRGEISQPSPHIHAEVARRARKLRIKWSIYAAIIAAIILLLALSLTVWSNPLPSRVADSFIDALNRKDVEAMKWHVLPSQRESAEGKLQELVRGLEENGSFRQLNYRTSEVDAYYSYVYLVEGSLGKDSLESEIRITSEDNLYLGLENSKGKWYIDLDNLHIFPGGH
jgi:uncharacterized membrane protein YvbJ